MSTTGIGSSILDLLARSPGRTVLLGEEGNPGRGMVASDLRAGAIRVACELMERGVGVGDLVAVIGTRDVRTVALALGVLLAGAGYVPIDPASPAPRRERILGVASPRLVLGRELPDGLEGIDILTLDPFDESADGADEVELPDVPGSGVAYVIFTSGSTGVPKGVCVTHDNVRGLAEAAREMASLPADAVWCNFHSFAFDVSVWEIWVPLLLGQRVSVPDAGTIADPERLQSFVKANSTAVLTFTPSALRLFTQVVGRRVTELTSVRYLVLCGELFDSRDAALWLPLVENGSLSIVNMYGITEVTVHATWHEVTPQDIVHGTRSVGMPLPGYSIEVVTNGEPAAVHEVGEIVVGGVGVADGYLNDEVQTNERFRTVCGRRVYHSGDLGHLNEDGSVSVFGRKDDQIKIRGYRVELAEVRHAVHDVVDGAPFAVLCFEEDSEATLTCFLETGAPGSATMRARLREILPDYMVPSRFLNVGRFPLNINGKLDVDRLTAWFQDLTGA